MTHLNLLLDLAGRPHGSDPGRLVPVAVATEPAATRELYLDLAAAFVDEAVNWVDEQGVVMDPVEGHDERWQGGTAARFACPASILVETRGRQDLIPVAARALTQLARGILAAAGRGTGFPAGVLDLTVKEIVVAYRFLHRHVAPEEAEEWRQALSLFAADQTYTTRRSVMAGRAVSNYTASAATGEWLRCQAGLGGQRAWVEESLGYIMPLFTASGMFRDPHDPVLYDLMVRQNLSELMMHGYDGALHERIAELLERAGTVMLQYVSPCGHAPFGGRSNGLLHNEAMVAYTCEVQAIMAQRAGRRHVAAAFREVARRAATAVAGWAHCRPLRYIKNRFAPESRHGKDCGYGEYANYALLAASLFARTALIADDSLPATVATVASRGSLLNLWPAFHKTFATCGHTHVEVDTRSQEHYDATGIGRFQRAGAPAALGLGMGIAATPKYLVSGAALVDRDVAIGPCWRTAAGEWAALAQLREAIDGVAFEAGKVTPETVSWRLCWSVYSGFGLPVTRIEQACSLRPGELTLRVAIDGIFEAAGFEVPCLVTDGESAADTAVAVAAVTVAHRGWVLQAAVPQASEVVLDSGVRANRDALYRVARFVVDSPTFEVQLSLEPGSD